jgi:MSHA biogenesis protein MshI
VLGALKVKPVMNQRAKYKPKKQDWLKISTDRLTLFETGMHSDGLPYLKVKETLKAESPLINAKKYAARVKQNTGRSQLNILIAEDLYQLLLSDVPDVPDEELDAAIELKAADLISYDLDDAILDVIRLPKEAYRGRMKMSFIIAMQKQPIQQWLIELIQQGITVNIVDVSVTQLRNFGLRTQNFTESGIFHIQESKCRLVLNYQNEMVLSRTFETGLKDFVGAEETVQEDELELTVDSNAQSTIQLESLALDIRRSFDYYEAQLSLGAIAELNILCEEASIEHAKTLAGKLGVRFNILDPADYLHIIRDQQANNNETYYELIGCAFREAF